MRLQLSCGLAVLALPLALSAPALAVTSSTQMSVGITVTASPCQVAVTDINFGSVSAAVLTAGPLNSTSGGVVTVTCTTSKTAPAVATDAGQHHQSGPPATNAMAGAASPTNLLPYTLAVTNLATAYSATGQTAVGTIVATIPTQTALPAVDTYSDIVTVTLTY